MPEANVKAFISSQMIAGIIQSFDDFDLKAEFENVNSYSKSSAKRKQELLVLPISTKRSSKSYTQYSQISCDPSLLNLPINSFL